MNTSTEYFTHPLEHQELATSLESLLYGYMVYAFQTGVSWQEAMSNYENARLLITTLNVMSYGDTRNQEAA